jgi:hypothetical protein
MISALVSPETGLAIVSANIAVGDWCVALGFRRYGRHRCLADRLSFSDFPQTFPR